MATTISKTDDGLKNYLVRIFNYMTLGLLTSGLVGYLVMSSPTAMQLLFGNQIIAWIVMLSPIGFVFYLASRINSMSAIKARNIFFVYSAVTGLSLSFIFAVYPVGNIIHALFIAGAMFGSMSLYGYTTKRDLTGIGSFMYMGLVGVIIATVVNMFFVNSSMMSYILDILIVVIFTGLTAYDMQKLKAIYHTVGNNAENRERAVVMGALNLYLDFLNLFLAILRLMGGRRS